MVPSAVRAAVRLRLVHVVAAAVAATAAFTLGEALGGALTVFVEHSSLAMRMTSNGRLTGMYGLSTLST